MNSALISKISGKASALLWPAVLALAVHNGGILGRLGAETIENLDPGPLRSLRVIGAPRRSVLAAAVFPLGLGRSCRPADDQNYRRRTQVTDPDGHILPTRPYRLDQRPGDDCAHNRAGLHANLVEG